MSSRIGRISKTVKPVKKKQRIDWKNILFIIFGLVMVFSMVVLAAAKF
jgi:hypothetical protein